MEENSDLEYEYHINTVNEGNVNQDGQLLTPRTIDGDITVSFVNILRRYASSGDEIILFEETVSPSEFKTITLSFLGSIDEESVRGKMDLMLSHMGIPQCVHEAIVRDVGLEVSSSNGYGDDDGDGFSFRIRVSIARVKYEEVEYTRLLEETMEGEAKLIPATKSSIEDLERKVFDNFENLIKCTICMEDIETGVEVIRMPCSHLYHGDCIVKWLQNSHVCPLCRYEMPVEH